MVFTDEILNVFVNTVLLFFPKVVDFAIFEAVEHVVVHFHELNKLI